MNFIDLLNTRYACKQYDNTKDVSSEHESLILESARLSPSSFGLEPWKFIAIRNKDLREKLRPACWGQAQITDSSFIVVVLSRASHNFRGKSEYIKQKVAAKGLSQDLQDNYISMISNFLMGVETTEWTKRQCYIALANMMNAATSIGVNSTPIEGFEPENVSKILKEFNINLDDFNVCVLCAFGYSKTAQPVKFRAAPAEVIQQI